MKNYSTTLSADQTLAQVQRLLARFGVRRQQVTYDEDATPSGLTFEIPTGFGVRAVILPVRIDGVAAALRNDKRTTAAQRSRKHAVRVAWRVAFDWLSAQLALVEAGMFTLDEVFLSQLLADEHDRTVYEVYAAKQRELTAGT